MLRKVKKLTVTILMFMIMIVFIFPFYMMLIMGTYKTETLFRTMVILPGDYIEQNFSTIKQSTFFHSYWNSFYIAVLVTLISSVSSAMAGFGFAKYQFRLCKPLFNVVLLTMMIPSQLGMIAFIWEMKQFGWTDTHLPLIIPAITSNFGVFWMRQYVRDSIPNEVIDSARIDGANDIRAFFQICLAFIKPALLSTGLLFFLWSWNSYMLPLLVITKPELQTIPLSIVSLRDYIRTDYGAQILGLSMGAIPMIIIFILFSKSLITGLAATAVKG